MVSGLCKNCAEDLCNQVTIVQYCLTHKLLEVSIFVCSSLGHGCLVVGIC